MILFYTFNLYMSNATLISYYVPEMFPAHSLHGNQKYSSFTNLKATHGFTFSTILLEFTIFDF